MARIDKQPSGTGVLRPRARILRTFGDELISSDIVAVLELVKNAYDADATRVLVRFQPPLDVGRGSIEIIDNGHGMSLDTIRTAWMEPATPYRRRKPWSEKRGRRVLGDKGIGRFAASRLANTLEIITRRAEANREIRAFFDWTQFDDEEKYLDEVEVWWEETEPREICPGGTIEVLWARSLQLPPDELTHGTILRMRSLRSAWDREQFDRLRKDLSRLISPFFGQDEISKGDEFQIRLELPEPFYDLSDVIEPPEILRNPHYFLSGTIQETGECHLFIRIRGWQQPMEVKKRLVLPDGHAPQCGPFRLELRVWDRDEKSLEELARQYGSTIKDVRRDLNNAAGISIYRDGFRVLPYGEPDNDWLRLDLRSRLNPTLRLANNQIAGYVLISADRNPLLRDQSDREGLIESPALDDLRELIKLALNELERIRYDIRPRLKKVGKKAGGLFADFNLDDMQNLLKERYPEDDEVAQLVERKAKDLKSRVKQVREVLARYHRLATLGQLIDTVLHEGRAPLAKITNEAELGIRDIDRIASDGKVPAERVRPRLEVIRTQAGVLATTFRRIEPFSGRKRGRPVSVCLEQVITNAFEVLQGQIAEVGARVRLPKTETWVTVDQAEIQQVIINLLQNSLYWLKQVPKSRREIMVTVDRKSDNEVEIVFSDSGPGVDPLSREYIFDPYFSTKPDGVGLGLTIAGEIVKEYYGGELELVDGGPLPGATFRIILRRRV